MLVSHPRACNSSWRQCFIIQNLLKRQGGQSWSRLSKHCCISPLTSRAACRYICARLAIVTDRALHEFAGRASIAKVPLGTLETLRGTRVVHELP